MRRDVDYVVTDDEVVIVDEFTGRLMAGRRYSDGLHQAIEAKEGIEVQNEHDSCNDHLPELLPDVSQAGRYDRYGETEEEEFKKIYGLEVANSYE